MQCPKCQAEVNQQAQFCWQCGASMKPESKPVGAAPGTAAAPGQPRWLVPAMAAVVVLALLAFLLLRNILPHGKLSSAPAGNTVSQPVTAGTPANQPAPSTPVTAATPGNTGTPVTAAQPGNRTPGAGLAQGTAPAPDPYRDEVAAYLRKLEAIQIRDKQSTPITQLTALAGMGMNAFSAQMRDLQGDDPSVPDRSKEGPDYNRIFAGILQQKQMIARDFQMIAPVPLPCMLLHKAYGAYLGATVRAIAQLQATARDANNPGAVFGALPVGQAADAALAYANQQEDAVRRRYGVSRTPQSLVP